MYERVRQPDKTDHGTLNSDRNMRNRCQRCRLKIAVDDFSHRHDSMHEAQYELGQSSVYVLCCVTSVVWSADRYDAGDA